MVHRPRLKLASLITASLLAFGTAQADVSYTYDELGRLIIVSDSVTGTVFYSYDAVGNIISIKPFIPGAPIPVSFSPRSGLPGTTVTIIGSSFSSDKNKNIVRLNGVQAEVVYATFTRVDFIVPFGATGGAVTLSTNDKTVDVGNFNVIQAPTSDGFSPTSGKPGTIVTINGNGFNPDKTKDIVKIGDVQAEILSASQKQLAFRVPSNALTGKITVSYGDKFADIGEFIVVHSPIIKDYSPTAGTPGIIVTINGTQFDQTKDNNIVKVNGQQAEIISVSPDKLSFRVPEGATSGKITASFGDQFSEAGDFNVLPIPVISLSHTAIRTGETLKIKSPTRPFPVNDNNIRVLFNGSNETAPINVTADELSVVVPEGFTEGKVTVNTEQIIYKGDTTLYTIPKQSGVTSSSISLVSDLTLSEQPVKVTTKITDTAVMLRVPLKSEVGTLSIVPEGTKPTGHFTAELVNPNGYRSKLIETDAANPVAMHLETSDFQDGQDGGVYTLILYGSISPSFSLSLSKVPDISIPLSPLTVSAFGLSKPGQYQIFTTPILDSGPIRLSFTNLSINNPTSLRKLNGDLISLNSGNSEIIDTVPDDQAVSWTLVPQANATSSGKLSIVGTAMNTTPVGSSPVPFSATFAEQWYRRKVATTAGQSLGIAVSDLNQPNGNGYGSITAEAPNGSSSAIYNGQFFQTLIIPDPGTGTTSITVSPMDGATSNSFTLHVGPSIPLSIGAASSVMKGAVNAHTFAHFNVNPGDKIQVVINGLNVGTGNAKVFIQRPDNYYSGTPATSGNDLVLRADGDISSGLHAVTIDPPPGGSVSAKIKLMSSQPTLVDGQITPLTTSVADDSIVHNVTGSSAAPRYLVVQGPTYSGATGNGQLTLFSPDGNRLLSPPLPTNYNWMFGNLNQNGPYSLMVSPPAGGKLSGKILSGPGTALTKGTQSSQSISAGQGKILTFNAAAGTTPKITFASLSPVPSSAAPVNVIVFRPDGNKVGSATYTSSTYSTITLPTVTSATAGTYVIGVFPANGQALTFKVTQN